MKHIDRRRIMAALLALLLTVLCGGALADETALPAEQSATVAALLEVPDFKFHVRTEGIGEGVFPVYTAPSEDSLRLADGRANCTADVEISVAGYVDGCLMVRYEIRDGKARVGYIMKNYSRGLKADVGNLQFASIPVKLAEAADITDNPRSNHTPFGTLPADTEITVLGKYTYTGNWWYIETKLDGKLTRGFIDRSTAAIEADGTVYRGNEALGHPVASPDGNRRTGTVTVAGSEEDARLVRKEATADSHMVARVYGEETYPCFGAAEGANQKEWYCIWVDGVWGWISSAVATYAEGE